MSLIPLLLPLFLLAGLGWALLRFRLIRRDWVAGTNDLTTRVLIPALLLLGTYHNGLPDNAPLALLLAYYLPFITLFSLLAFVFRAQAERAQLSLAALYANTVFIGIPVVVQVLGEASLEFVFPIIAFHSLIGFSLYYLTDSLAEGGSRLLPAVAKTLRNPLVFSLLLGLLLNVSGLSLPAWLLQPLGMLADASLPSALLVLGASLAQFKLGYSLKSLTVVVTKLLLLPVLVLVAAVFLFRLGTEAATVLVILSSGPTGINAYILASNDNKGVEVVSSVILLSSLLYLLTLPAWLFIMTLVA